MADLHALLTAWWDDTLPADYIIDRNGNYRSQADCIEDLVIRARAALAAEGPAVTPSGARGPGSVAEQPSDDELRDLWSWSAGQDQGPWPTQYHCFARAVLARFGNRQ